MKGTGGGSGDVSMDEDDGDAASCASEIYTQMKPAKSMKDILTLKNEERKMIGREKRNIGIRK